MTFKTIKLTVIFIKLLFIIMIQVEIIKLIY